MFLCSNGINFLAFFLFIYWNLFEFVWAYALFTEYA